MIIHNPILTGSFSVNGADLSTITGSVATSASFDARTTYLESTSSILTAASASQSVTSGSLVAASASLSATSGSLSAASGSFNTRVSALEATGSALSSSLLTVSGSGYATSASLSAASGSFNTRVATIESKYATTGSNTFIGTQVVSGSILQSGSFTSTGTLTAQTLVIQTITSSVVYSSGSNVFGNSLGNSQVFTGSVLITGSLALAGNITSNGTAVVLGSGTSGYLPKFTGTSTVGNSVIQEASSNIGIGVSPSYKLDVNGATQFRDDIRFSTTNSSIGYTDAIRFVELSVSTRMTLSSGNLGLGVTPSNAYADSRTFEIGAGGILWSEQAASVYNSMSIGSNFYYNAAGSLLYKNAAVAASRFTQYQGSHIWYTAGVAPSAGAAITFTQAMTLNASGNLGLGVTPFDNSLSVGLDIGIGAGLFGYNNRFILSANAYYNANWKYKATAAAAVIKSEVDSSIQFLNAPSGTAGDAITFTQAMTLLANGNLLLGTTSAQSGTRLQVAGVMDVWSSTNTLLRLNHDGSRGTIETFTGGAYGITAINPNGGNVLIGTTTDNSYKLRVVTSGAVGLRIDTTGSTYSSPSFAMINGSVDTTISATTNGLEISTYSNHDMLFRTNQVERMRIASTGAATFSSSVTAGDQIRVTGTTANALYLYGAATVKPYITINEFGVRDWKIGAGTTSSGKLSITATLAGTDGITIDGSGNVGVGTSAPAELLHVYSAGTTGGNIRMTDAGLSNADWSLLPSTGNTTAVFRIYNRGTAKDVFNASTAGTITFNQYGAGSLSTNSSGVISASDGRYKTKTRSVTNALDDVMQLNPTYYRWNEDSEFHTEHEELGFIAQEVASVIPAASPEPEQADRYKNYHDRAIIAVLTKAIQELQAQITELKNK